MEERAAADRATQGPAAGEPASAPGRGPRRWPRVAVLAVVLVAVVVIGVLFLGGRTRPVSEGDALGRFRTGAGVAGSPVPVGVYPAVADAIETVGLAPLDRTVSGPVPVTVTGAGDGCSEVRVDLESDHWRSWTLCRTAAGPALSAGASATSRTFPGIDFSSTTEVTCDPPAGSGPDGAPATALCSVRAGGGMAGSGQLRSRATAGPGPPVQVGGDRVATTRFGLDNTLAGVQDGTERVEFLLASDGLPVRISYRTVVQASTSLGVISYTDRGEVTLRSTRPRT